MEEVVDWKYGKRENVIKKDKERERDSRKKMWKDRWKVESVQQRIKVYEKTHTMNYDLCS